MDYPSDACFEVRAALPLFVGGDLEREELTAVEAHLAGCPACEELHVRARGARAVLTERRAVAREARAPELWPGVRARLREEGVLAPAGPRPLTRPAPALRLVPAGILSAAAAVVCAFLLAGLFRPDGAVEPAGGPVAGTFGRGGGVTDVTPVDHRATGLRKVDGGDALYHRAREFRAEQGLITTPTPGVMQPAGLRRVNDR